MIIVPIEDNKVGLATATDAKFRAPDYSGSGLEALGAGLARLGEGGRQLAGGIEERRRRAAEAIATAMLDDRHQGNIDDAAVKQAYIDYSDQAHEALHGDDGLSQQRGAGAHAAFPALVGKLADNHDKALARLDEVQRGVLAPMLGDRLRSDVERAANHVREQGKAEQEWQSEKLQQAAARDAVANFGDPDLHDHHMATGENAIRQQGRIGNLPDKEVDRQVADYKSAVHAATIEALAETDPAQAADWYDRYGNYLNQHDWQRAEVRLRVLPVMQAVAPTIGDVGARGAGADRMLATPSPYPPGLVPAFFDAFPSAEAAVAAGDVPTADAVDQDHAASDVSQGSPTMRQLDNWLTSLSDDEGKPARTTESHDNSALISTGKGDAGGPSYGSYQLAQNRGQVPQFLASEGAPWAKELGAAPIYSKEFKEIWKKIAIRDGQKFKDAENAFARRTKYDPVMLAIGKNLQFNLSTRSVAVRAAVLAAANHMGPGGKTRDNGAYGVVRRAILQTDQSLSRGDPGYDLQLVGNIYGQRKAILLRMADHLLKQSEDPRLPPAKRADAKRKGITLRNSAQNTFTNEQSQALGIIATERQRYPAGF